MSKIILGTIFIFLLKCLSCVNLHAGFESWHPFGIKKITGKHYIVAAFLRSLMKGKLEVQSDEHKPTFFIRDTINISMPIKDACVIMQKLDQRLNRFQPPKILSDQQNHDFERIRYKKALLAFYDFKMMNDLHRLASATDWNRLQSNRQALLAAFNQSNVHQVLIYCNKPYSMKHKQQKKTSNESSCVLL